MTLLSVLGQQVERAIVLPIVDVESGEGKGALSILRELNVLENLATLLFFVRKISLKQKRNAVRQESPPAFEIEEDAPGLPWLFVVQVTIGLRVLEGWHVSCPGDVAVIDERLRILAQEVVRVGEENLCLGGLGEDAMSDFQHLDRHLIVLVEEEALCMIQQKFHRDTPQEAVITVNFNAFQQIA